MKTETQAHVVRLSKGGFLTVYPMFPGSFNVKYSISGVLPFGASRTGNVFDLTLCRIVEEKTGEHYIVKISNFMETDDINKPQLDAMGIIAALIERKYVKGDLEKWRQASDAQQAVVEAVEAYHKAMKQLGAVSTGSGFRLFNLRHEFINYVNPTSIAP